MHFYCGNVFKVKCLNVFLSVTNKMFTNEQSERSASDKISPSSSSGRGGGAKTSSGGGTTLFSGDFSGTGDVVLCFLAGEPPEPSSDSDLSRSDQQV